MVTWAKIQLWLCSSNSFVANIVPINNTWNVIYYTPHFKLADKGSSYNPAGASLLPMMILLVCFTNYGLRAELNDHQIMDVILCNLLTPCMDYSSWRTSGSNPDTSSDQLSHLNLLILINTWQHYNEHINISQQTVQERKKCI